MKGFLVCAAALMAAVVFADIPPEELQELGLREIKSIQRYADKEVELSFPKALAPVKVNTENYVVKAELSSADFGPVVYIKYTVYDPDQNFIKAFRVKGNVAIWTDALYAKRVLYKGEEVTLEDFYLKRTDLLKHSRQLAGETSFRAAQVMTVDLRPDLPLMGWMLSVKKLINSGERVLLYVKSDTVTVKIEGKALQGGVLGEKILVQVQNEKKRALQAEISGPGECQVKI